MPQFDSTTFISQIFWLILCFVALYSFIDLVIVPRISKIIEERDDIIQGNRIEATKLQEEVSAINDKINEVKFSANKIYKTKIEEAAANSSKISEEFKVRLKNEIANKIDSAKQEINNFVEGNQNEKISLAKSISNLIKQRIFR
jgi:F-type H+-transporting ATPase subunit b